MAQLSQELILSFAQQLNLLSVVELAQDCANGLHGVRFSASNILNIMCAGLGTRVEVAKRRIRHSDCVRRTTFFAAAGLLISIDGNGGLLC